MHRSEKVKGLLEDLCRGLYERDEVVKLALLAAVSGESLFLLGPPYRSKQAWRRRINL